VRAHDARKPSNFVPWLDLCAFLRGVEAEECMDSARREEKRKEGMEKERREERENKEGRGGRGKPAKKREGDSREVRERLW